MLTMIQRMIGVAVTGLRASAEVLRSKRFKVAGKSMEPTYVRGQHLFVGGGLRGVDIPRRGDVVVIHDSEEWCILYLKRIVGLPGEHVSSTNGRVMINGDYLQEPYVAIQPVGDDQEHQWILGSNEFIVLGDRRDWSHDSRSFGAVQLHQIVGRAWFCYWPREKWGYVSRMC